MTTCSASLHTRAALIHRTPRAIGDAPHEGPSQRMLMSLLELSLGSTTLAQAAIAHALASSGRTELPSSHAELLVFVRAHLVSVVASELGPRIALALFDDLTDKLSGERPESGAPPPSSTPPVSRPRPIAGRERPRTSAPAAPPKLKTLLVDPDMIRRPAIARAFIRLGWTVIVVDCPADIVRASHCGEEFDVAVVDLNHSLAAAIVLEFSRCYPRTAVIARSDDLTRAQHALSDLSLPRFDVRAKDAPAEELIDATRRILGI